VSMLPGMYLVGHEDAAGVLWRMGTAADANPLLTRHHYLGPIESGGAQLIVAGELDGEVVAVQVWRRQTSRWLPSDGSWLELSRWCLTPGAGSSAGSRQHRYAVRIIREHLPRATTLVSYSDPSEGHTGALYRACNWQWRPTWHRLRTPPTGNGSWDGELAQQVKDRWVFGLRPDPGREQLTYIDDAPAIRHWVATATPAELRWARSHPQLGPLVP
jgi:hypothetical protein